MTQGFTFVPNASEYSSQVAIMLGNLFENKRHVYEKRDVTYIEDGEAIAKHNCLSQFKIQANIPDDDGNFEELLIGIFDYASEKDQARVYITSAGEIYTEHNAPESLLALLTRFKSEKFN